MGHSYPMSWANSLNWLEEPPRRVLRQSTSAGTVPAVPGRTVYQLHQFPEFLFVEFSRRPYVKTGVLEVRGSSRRVWRMPIFFPIFALRFPSRWAPGIDVPAKGTRNLSALTIHAENDCVRVFLD